MTTARNTSWHATTARRWRRCSSTWRAAAFRRRHHERGFGARRDRAASDCGDDPALLVSLDVVMAAPARADLLAGAADHHLGLPAELHLAKCRLLCPRRRDID